jgi:hypothetical protein
MNLSQTSRNPEPGLSADASNEASAKLEALAKAETRKLEPDHENRRS